MRLIIIQFRDFKRLLKIKSKEKREANDLIWLEKMTPVLNFLVPHELRELGPSKQIKMIRRLNTSRLSIIGRFKHLLKSIKKKRIKLKKQESPWKEGRQRRLKTRFVWS